MSSPDQKNRRPHADVKWQTEEWAGISAKRLHDELTTTIQDARYFGLALECHYYTQTDHPIGFSATQGLRDICLVDLSTNRIAQFEDARKLLVNYTVKTIIASAVFFDERVGVRGLLNPLESAIFGANLDMTWTEAMQTGSPDRAILKLAEIMSETPSWKLQDSIEGRIKLFVEPVVELLKEPRLIETAIERIEAGSGVWGGHKKSGYSIAVAMAMKELMKF